MKNIVIIGAGSFGREVYNLALECKEYGSEYTIKGFIDNLYDTMEYDGYPSILSRIDEYDPEENDVFVCALGDVKWKKHYVQLILDKGGNFITLIHPNTYISRNVTIGNGCIICQQGFISCEVSIGDYTTIQPHVVVGHDCKIGNMCQINSNTSLGGGVKIEDNVTVHMGVVLLPQSKVHVNSVVGAGSVVLRKVPANTTVFGNPAYPI